ncbi:cornifelin homolog B-like [Gymnodraco acuticeps]|uniref:Cornifelin homolog B-like n=1 Tax=Gymnodraco acuticeps TaxID=8218 RepID=A0A6P8U6X8_GYMAC|nr:cornifelin homolog B-like [Gymnodraco acuticeps]
MGAPPPEKEWSSDLFDCFEDHATCCYGFWCGPCLACTVTGRFGENRLLPVCDILSMCTSVMCGIPVYVPPAVLSVRVAMRNRYHIKGSLCGDMCVSCLCQWCSWCQMHRELKHRNKTPNVIVVQSQPIIQMQPAPMMMVAQAGYVTQPGVTVISN